MATELHHFQDEASFRQYFGTMPWCALPWSDRNREQSLKMVYNVRGIPSVILLSGAGNLIDPSARGRAVHPSFPSSLPRLIEVQDVAPLPEGPVVLKVLHQKETYEVECEPQEGWELLRMQIFSMTEVPAEQQRLFGLGVPSGALREDVPLEKAIAIAVAEDKKAGGSGSASIVVLGNASAGDPFEVAGQEAKAQDPNAKMIQEQHLAMLQARLSSATPREQNQVNSYQHVLKYEDLKAQRAALDQVPVCRLHEEAVKATDSYEVAFMKQLLRWFKTEFFTWCNAPVCVHCGSKKTKTVGSTGPTPVEKAFGAGHVEVAQCGDCGAQTRFPRYNDPEKLLESRTGRCGEWANCFTLMCRALGYEARHVHDWTDHVWTEIWSDSLKRWLHADSCEAALDAPLIYEQGWGKKLTYVLAFGRDNVCDVTKRYTKKFNELLTRRTQCTEQSLANVMRAIDEYARDSSMSSVADAESRRKLLEQRADEEKKQFAEGHQEAAKAEENVGRTSGDKEWREQRGELGATAAAKQKAVELSEQGVADMTAARSVPGSWMNSAENMSLKEGLLTADLRRRDGSMNHTSVKVEAGASYSNDDGNFVVEARTAPAAAPAPTCATPSAAPEAAPAGAAAPPKDASKADMQALIKAKFAELVKGGMAPNDAAAKAIEEVKKQMSFNPPARS
eukprot:TRINITY_DN26243_c0_g1_i1.p1 TRINITY_DN26243_c0_g1~~TRINITY_DN26243_c0_g1_i1.p1  ORF type:complete len:677 (+),score=184.97 TRINITY_DN26243_c0_g1_i1:223-2253(+)